MSIHAVCLVLEQSGRVARCACAVMLFLLAAHAESCASSLDQSGRVSLLSESPGNSFDVTADDCADGADAGEFLTGKTVFAPATPFQFDSTLLTFAESASGAPSSQTTVTGNRVPDWDGIWRDTGTFFGTQVVAAGIIYTMPQSVSGWSSEEKKNSFNKYADNVGDPVFDKDKFYINYVLHPYWGATYYIRGRERGLDRVSAFAYSALISAMYEFGVECFFEKPSIQDLIVTPVAGSLLGLLVFEPWRDSIRRKQELRWYDHVAMVVTDPLGVLSIGIEKVLGIRSTVTFNYTIPQLQGRSTAASSASKGSRIGAAMQISLD